MTSTRPHATNANNYLGQTAVAVPARTLREMDRAKYVPALDLNGERIYVRREHLTLRNASFRFRSFAFTARLWLDAADGKAITTKIDWNRETGDNPLHIAHADYPTKIAQAAAKLADAEAAFRGMETPYWVTLEVAALRARVTRHRSQLRIIGAATPAWWTFGKPQTNWMDEAVAKVRAKWAARVQPLSIETALKARRLLAAPQPFGGYKRMALAPLAA